MIANRIETSSTESSDSTTDSKTPRNGPIARSVDRYTNSTKPAEGSAPKSCKRNARNNRTIVIATHAYTIHTSARQILITTVLVLGLIPDPHALGRPPTNVPQSCITTVR